MICSHNHIYWISFQIYRNYHCVLYLLELNINFIKDIENAVNQAEVMDNKNMLYIFYKKETYLLPLFLCDEWMEEVEGESIQERTERHFREIGGETITIRKGRKENERFNQIRKA